MVKTAINWLKFTIFLKSNYEKSLNFNFKEVKIFKPTVYINYSKHCYWFFVGWSQVLQTNQIKCLDLMLNFNIRKQLKSYLLLSVIQEQSYHYKFVNVMIVFFYLSQVSSSQIVMIKKSFLLNNRIFFQNTALSTFQSI